MTTAKKQQVMYSQVRYCPNPGTEDGMVELGMVIEVKTPKLWLVAAAVRADIPKAALEGYDELTRTVLERRAEVLNREIESAIGKAEKFGDVLAVLSADNPWALSIAPAQAANLPLDPEGQTAEQLAQKVISAIVVHAVEQRRESRRAAELINPRTPGAKSERAPWLRAPVTFWMPFVPEPSRVPA